MLFAIEGIDGAGKGTLARNLSARASEAGFRVAGLSFPRYRETPFATLISQYLNGRFGSLDQVSVHFASLLYAGDRYDSKAKLLELMASHDLVILDRYVASNVAYNAAKVAAAERPSLVDWILELEYEVFGLPKADLTCLLGTRPEIADDLVARKQQRSYTDRTRDLHEADRSYMTGVAALYDELCAAGRMSTWFRFDPFDSSGALLPPDRIADVVWQRVRDALAQTGS